MNVLVRTIGGGIFSTFVIAIQSILNQINDLESINNIYIEFDKNRNSETRHNLHLNQKIMPLYFFLKQLTKHINYE